MNLERQLARSLPPRHQQSRTGPRVRLDSIPPPLALSTATSPSPVAEQSEPSSKAQPETVIRRKGTRLVSTPFIQDLRLITCRIGPVKTGQSPSSAQPVDVEDRTASWCSHQPYLCTSRFCGLVSESISFGAHNSNHANCRFHPPGRSAVNFDAESRRSTVVAPAAEVFTALNDPDTVWNLVNVIGLPTPKYLIWRPSLRSLYPSW